MNSPDQNPLVSVILPVYNGAAFIAEAISSALEQTYKPVEIIAVDDGSTDESAARIGEFGSRVQYHFQANRGTGAARDAGVELASGEFLAFLDQDDTWLAHKLESQMSFFENDPELGAVFGWVEQFYDNPVADIEPRNKLAEGLLPSVLLIRREAFRRVGLFQTQYVIGEWADWYVRAVESGIKMLIPNRVVARRRIHAANKGIRFSDAQVEYARIMRASLARRRGRV